MAVMYSFCRYFSVRLGGILVGVSSTIQSLVIGSVFLYWLNNLDQSRVSLQDWISSNKLLYVTSIFESVQQNTELYLQSAVVLAMLHISTCALLIHAAFKCNVPLMWPFLTVEFFRLAMLFFVHVTAMMLTKENVLDLGVLITLSLTGGFLLLGLYYCWFCVISLCQCIRELNDMPPTSTDEDNNVNYLAFDFKHLTKVAQGFRTTQNYNFYAMPHLGNKDYRYGSLTKPTY